MQRILSIPLLNVEHVDTTVWCGDGTGEFLAKSGYNWLMANGIEGEGVLYSLHNDSTAVFYNIL